MEGAVEGTELTLGELDDDSLGFALTDGNSEGIEDGTPDTLGSKEGVVVG